MARLTYAPGRDEIWRPLWDVRIAKLLIGPVPDLWTVLGALTGKPLLLVRGEESNTLLPGRVARTQALRPDREVVSLPGIGHAPTLGEPEVVAALLSFLARVA